MLPHDAASLLLLEAEHETVRVAGSHGYDEHADGGNISGKRFQISELADLENMIKDRRPWIMPDTRLDPRWKDVPETRWVRAHLGAPVMAEDQAIGFFNLDSATPGIYTPADAARLHAFADQAAIAIRNAQLFAAEQDQRALSDALRDMAAVLNSTLDLDEIFDRLLANIGRAVPHTASNITLVEGNRLRTVRVRGYDAFGTEEWTLAQEFSVDERPSDQRAVEGGQPFFISNTTADPDWQSFPETAWIRSHLAAPIRTETGVIGIISLDSHQPGIFTQAHAERLQVFADQAAIAIQNARLYEELSRHADELAVLYRGTSFLLTSLSTLTDLSEISQQIAEAVVREFKQVDCGVLLVDTSSEQLVRLGRAGDYQTQGLRTLYLDGPGLVPAAVRAAHTLYVPDVAADPRYLSGDPRTRSELVVPLPTGKGIIGVLDLQSSEYDAFSQQDRHILEAFAERVAAAIENRQLYAEIRRYTDELEQRVAERTVDLSVRNAVAETLSSSLDVNEMLDGVLRTTVERLGVRGGAIYLLSADGTEMEMVTSCGMPEEALKLAAGIPPEYPDRDHDQQDEWPDAQAEPDPHQRHLGGDQCADLGGSSRSRASLPWSTTSRVPGATMSGGCSMPSGGRSGLLWQTHSCIARRCMTKQISALFSRA